MRRSLAFTTGFNFIWKSKRVTQRREREAKERPFVADTKARQKKLAKEQAAKEAKENAARIAIGKHRQEIEKMEAETDELLLELYHTTPSSSSPTEPNCCSDDDSSDYDDSETSDDEEQSNDSDNYNMPHRQLVSHQHRAQEILKRCKASPT